MRSLQFLPWFLDAGISCTVHPFFSDDVLQKRYEMGHYGAGELLYSYGMRLQQLLKRKQFDLILIEKEALPWFPTSLERMLLSGVPYVLDYDDAVFHNYDQHSNLWVRRIYGRRLDGLMANAALVVGGNNYLAQRARNAGAPWVEVLPTVIDLNRYPVADQAPTVALASDGIPRIVWIGSPSTARYLQLLREPLRVLAERQSFVLRVIGGGEVDLPGVPLEIMQWSEDTEVECISACDVGVMPLVDSLWEQGKCGYKLIQYMACGLPVVASRVGVNPEIVHHGDNGFLAADSHEWVSALGKLLADRALRTQMGMKGRHYVEQKYCIQQTGPRLAELLRLAGDVN